MQETTQPNIARRSIFASIDVTDTLVRRAARTYSTIRGVLMTASERLDHFDSRLPPLLRRPLARTATSSPSQRPRYECPQTVTTSRRRTRRRNPAPPVTSERSSPAFAPNPPNPIGLRPQTNPQDTQFQPPTTPFGPDTPPDPARTAI